MISAQPVSSAAREGGAGVVCPPTTRAANPIPQTGPALAPAAACERGATACLPDGHASAGGSSPCPLFSRSDDAQLAPSARPAREGSLSPLERMKGRRAYKPFDKEARVAAIREALARGLNRREVAAELGLSYWTVEETMKRNGLRVSYEARAAMAIKNRAASLAEAQQRRARAVELAATLDARAIAERIGLSVSRVHDLLREGGVRPAAKAAPPKPEAPKVTTREARAEARRADADALRRLVEQGMPIVTAGKRLGFTLTRTKKLASDFAIRADKLAVKNYLKALMRQRVAEGTFKTRGKAASKPQVREPEERRSDKRGLTEAQQQNILALKARTWRNAGRRLPIPTKEEAEAAIAAFLARRSVTVCQPAARIETAGNPLAPWRNGTHASDGETGRRAMPRRS